MMTPDDLIRQYIRSIIHDEVHLMCDHRGQIVAFSPLLNFRRLIADKIRTMEWFLMGYGNHLFNVLLRIGDQFLLKDNIKIAKKFFSEAMQLFPKVALCYLKIAECHHRMKEHGTAERNCIEAIRICQIAREDLPVEHMTRIVDILMAADGLDSALSVCYMILHRDYSNVDIQRRLIEIVRMLDKKKEAGKQRKENEKLPVEKTTGPSIGYDVIAGVGSLQRSQQSSVTGKLPVDKISSAMDQTLNSGAVVRCFCPKCSSPRDIKSKMSKCHICQSDLKLRYRKVNGNDWIEPRKPPNNVLGKYAQCQHYQLGRPCVKTPCTFPHGQDELDIWELCRGKGRSTSEPTTEQMYSSVTEEIYPVPAKRPTKKFQIRCGFCQMLLKTADEAQVIRERLLCKTCNRTEWPVQQFWDNQSIKFRSLRRKPSGVTNVKNIQVCWHYEWNGEHLMPECKFAHGVIEKELWEKEIEEGPASTKKKEKSAFTAREKPPESYPTSALDIALSFLEKDKLRCRHCDVSFPTLRELEHHNSEPQHKIAVMRKLVTQPEAMSEPESEVGVKCRRPPDGVEKGRCMLCPRFMNGWCPLGNNCTFAHGPSELEQWVEIYKRQNQHLSRLRNEKLLLESFSQKVQRRMNTEGRNALKKSLSGITIDCSSSYEVNLNNKQDHVWIFDVGVKTVPKQLLKQVAFLKEDHLDKFKLLKSPGENQITSGTQSVEFTEDDFVGDRQEAAVQFCVKFSSSVFGIFEQELILDFGSEFYFSQTLSVSVMSDDFRKNEEYTQQSVFCQILEWSVEHMEFIPCSELMDENGLGHYHNIPLGLPDPSKIEEFTPETYCTGWHDVLFIEELHIHQEIARYDIMNAQMNLITTFQKDLERTVFAVPGELFGEISLIDHLFMDEVSGHLIKRSVLSVIIRPKQRHRNGTRVYECAIKLTKDQSVVVKVNSELCKDLSLQKGMGVKVDLKFRYNGLPMYQMHEAIDRCQTKTSFLFPAVTPKQNIPKESISTWFMKDKPNNNQVEAIKMILGPGPAPPLLLIGPFGTGKTYTLNLACVQIFQKSSHSKVLICTHSNSAADIHLRLLHNKITGKQSSKCNLWPLRIVDTRRDVATIPEDLRQYCLLDDNNPTGVVVCAKPTWNDLREHNVIITTLATSRVLWPFHDEGKLSFTHILIDEAAQALEPECVSPLTIADCTTKVALAGDHVQMGPSTYSKGWLDHFGPKRSLLQRLFTHYNTIRKPSAASQKKPLKLPNVVMLTENYRCHEDILSFPSEIFYGGELVARGNQPKHPSIPALSFYTAQGQDEKLEGGLEYYNLAEVNEVVRRVEELVDLWPKDWELSIGVLAPYRDQVQKIRAALRRKRLHQVKVQTVENVQGQEFKALFISTVRTGYTCWRIEERNSDSTDLDFGFLSDERLLNTAVTRAQSLLAVVGDPMSLCTIGACQEIWKKYLKRCDRNNAFHGCTLKLVKDFCLSNRALNPDAQEFAPSQATNQADGGNVQSSTSGTTVPFGAHAVVNTTSGSLTPGRDQSRGAGSSSLRKTGGNPDLPSNNQMTTRKVNPFSNSPQSTNLENKWAVENGSTRQLPDYSAASVGHPDETSSVLSEEDNVDGSKDEEDQSTEDFFSFDDDENYDEIINALVQACRETKKNDELEQNQASNEDSLPPSTFEIPQKTPQCSRQITSRIFSAGMRKGRFELGFHVKENERLFRLNGGHSSTKTSGDSSYNDTQAFNSDELVALLKANPEGFSQCTLRINTSGRQWRYCGQVPDPDSPDILIPGRVRGAYEDDVVVVEMQQSKASDGGDEQTKSGFIKGILRTPINPKERQFVCAVDRENLGVMSPISIARPRMVNFTKTDEEGIIPIYEMVNDRVRKVIVLQGKKVEEALARERLFVVRFLKWRMDCPYPLGLAVRHLPCGKDFETGMEILYEEYNVKRTFGGNVQRICEQKYRNAEEWAIPEGEKVRPVYCTGVFTVDSPESRDLDDAISIRVLSNGNYQVHIHIADVSYFVRPNTELDDEARSRGTSYYPPKPHEVVPMLPRELSEGCCSLLQGKDRLAMTLSVELSCDGTVVGEPKIERSIVRSCCRLTYGEAQEIINEGRWNDDLVDHEVKSCGVTATCGDEGPSVKRKNKKRNRKKKKKEGGKFNREERKESEEQQEPSGSDGAVGQEREKIKVEQNEEVRENTGRTEKENGLKTMKDIPETESGSMKKKKTIPDIVKNAILLVHKLAVNRRKARLGERSFHHRQEDGDEDDMENAEAHEMIAEMMIMTNHLVAKYLLSKFPKCTPLRVQLPPKTRRVEEWKLRFQKFARYSLGIKSLADAGKDVDNVAEPDIKVPSKTWEKIMSALSLVVDDDSNFQELVKLVCNLDQYPQLALAYAHQQRLEQRASYTCSGEAPEISARNHVKNSSLRDYKNVSNTKNVSQEDSKKVFHGHSSLELDAFCHFTSPIRRYIDVIVHRLLVACSDPKEAGNHGSPHTTEEIATICGRCTFLARNSGRFHRDARKLQLSLNLQNSIKFVNAWIDEVARDSFKLYFGSKEYDLLPGKDKTIRVARLSPIKDPTVHDDGIIVEWTFRVLYLGKDSYSQPDRDETVDEELVSFAVDQDKAAKEDANATLDVPGKSWRTLLQAIKNNDHKRLKQCVKAIDQDVQRRKPGHPDLPNQNSLDEGPRSVRSRKPYQRPKRDKTSSSIRETSGFLYVTRAFNPCDTVNVQLCSHVSCGILSPTIQLFEVTKRMHVCVEHRNSPTDCFVNSSPKVASLKRYDSVEQYISLWYPVMMMEITTSAVQEDDTITLFNLQVKFSREANKVSMEFSLSSAYCRNNGLEILYLDLLCVKVKDLKDKGQESGFWVGHFQVTKCVEKAKEKKLLEIKADFLQSSSAIPEYIDKKRLVTVEVVHLCTPDRNHLAALKHCDVASDLIKDICMGVHHVGKPGDISLPRKDLSLSKDYPSMFNPLNEYQNEAVKDALTKPFTLIQGPPGTGKTVTGVHIAYWFAKMNKTRPRTDPTVLTEEPEIPNDQSVVFYCGPSNKSVDVVARYLKKISELKILRIYSEEIEQKEFPIPDKIRAFRRKHSSANLKVDEELVDVCLHHVIRSSESPYATKLKEYDEYFEGCLKKNDDAKVKKINNYKKEKKAAEEWAICQNEVDVILCTCTSAYSSRIKENLNKFRQCIVDECGMCIEAETLCAMFGSSASQVVLIGDHKQLQPVLKNEKAKQLGLGISMFERYSKKSKMLEIQYRMHEEICEFPSKYFYDGKLKTAEQVRQRVPHPVRLWPKGINYPFLFHHTEGKEESLIVTTEQGNENSKKNDKEISKVVYFTRSLVQDGIDQDSILVLSPYKAQCFYVKVKLLEHGLDKVSVMTVVASQGSEKDYVILSLVRSLPEEEIEKNPSRSWLRENLGFITDEHQINVALTRPKRGLCIVGNANLVRVCDVWKNLLKHYEKNESFVTDNDHRRQ